MNVLLQFSIVSISVQLNFFTISSRGPAKTKVVLRASYMKKLPRGKLYGIANLSGK